MYLGVYGSVFFADIDLTNQMSRLPRNPVYGARSPDMQWFTYQTCPNRICVLRRPSWPWSNCPRCDDVSSKLKLRLSDTGLDLLDEFALIRCDRLAQYCAEDHGVQHLGGTSMGISKPQRSWSQRATSRSPPGAPRLVGPSGHPGGQGFLAWTLFVALLEFLLVADPSSVDPLKFSEITTVMTAQRGGGVGWRISGLPTTSGFKICKAVGKEILVKSVQLIGNVRRILCQFFCWDPP